MPKHTIFALKILSISLVLCLFGWSGAQAQQIDSSGPKIVSRTESSITLEYVVDNFEIIQIQGANGQFDRIDIAGTTQQSEPGQPRLPVAAVTIGIPAEAVPSVEIISSETEALLGNYRLPTAKLLLSQDLPDNLFDSDVTGLTVEEELVDYSVTDISNGSHQPVTLSAPSMIRDQRVVQVQFSPVSYDSVEKRITLYRRIQVQISWTTPAVHAASSSKAVSPHFESVLRETVLNYDELEREIDSAHGATNKLQAASVITGSTTTTNTLKITTNQAGFHRIDRNMLKASGFNLDADPQNLRLSNKGKEVAIWVTGEEDGSFDEDDAIIFYAELHETVYSGQNVYWLTNSVSPGIRMQAVDGSLDGAVEPPQRFRQSIHAEVNDYYWLTMPTGAGQDHWFWEGRQTAPITTTRVITIASPFTGTDAAGLTAELRVALKGGTDDSVELDHHTRILFNGIPVDDQLWDGLSIFTHTVEITQSLINDGPNTIAIQLLGDTGATVDQIFVDWIELEYWGQNRATNNMISFPTATGRAEFSIEGFTEPSVQLFDTSNPAAVRRITDIVIDDSSDEISIRFTHSSATPINYVGLTESGYLTPTELLLGTKPTLRSITNGADYILITHRDFLTRTVPLAEFRETQGLRVISTTITDIFDEFNHGIFDPQAIRDFLAHAYQSWEAPAPTYVLLVGDASLDFHDRYNTNSINFVPSQIIETEVLGQTPSDNWFVQISGDDVLPDMLIGRLSAQLPEQVTQVVQKIIAYETNPPDESWNSSVLFVADDDSTSFTTTSEELGALMPQEYTINRIDIETYEEGADPPADINAAINQGALFTNYTGHGAASRWGKWGENLSIYGNDDAANLTNKGKETILTIANCLNGFFTGFQTSFALAEQFQRHDNGGAVAVWAPSNIFYPSAHRALLSEFYSELYQEETVSPRTVSLGAATTRAKISTYAQSSSWDELVETFILFGDPATSLEQVFRQQSTKELFLPLVTSGE